MCYFLYMKLDASFALSGEKKSQQVTHVFKFTTEVKRYDNLQWTMQEHSFHSYNAAKFFYMKNYRKGSNSKLY
jgi:hypothetical protein